MGLEASLWKLVPHGAIFNLLENSPVENRLSYLRKPVIEASIRLEV